MSRRGFTRLCGVVLLLAAGLAQAADGVRPFAPGSLAGILAARAGRPFILAFWSVTCSHCPVEMKALAELKRRQPGLELVLVAADTPSDAAAVQALPKRLGLGQVEQWLFADDMPERLRFEIDRRWYGELPRTHFYDRQHQLTAVSGIVPPAQLAAWAKENGR